MKKLLFLFLFASISFACFAQTADTTLRGTLVSKAPDATSVSYLWTKISGPSGGVITSPTSLVTQVTGLPVGVHTFQLVATDNFGVKSAPSQTTITVVRQNIPPVINAGPDIIIQAK